MAHNQKIQLDPDDGLPLMEVGSWSEDKHILIKKFVHASWAARSKWPQRTYIDLFCGPGKISIRDSGQILDGSPLIAWKESQMHGGAFTDIFIADVDSNSTSACYRRLQTLKANVYAEHGDVQSSLLKVLPHLRSDGLHLVVLDPFNIGTLDFSIFRNLSNLKQVDIILHLSVMDVQRNIDNEYKNIGGPLDKFAPGWRENINIAEMGKERGRNAFLEYWTKLVSRLGFKVAARAPLMRNQRNAPLYRLMLMYRHPLAERIWNDVARHRNQRDLFGLS